MALVLTPEVLAKCLVPCAGAGCGAGAECSDWCSTTCTGTCTSTGHVAPGTRHSGEVVDVDTSDFRD